MATVKFVSDIPPGSQDPEDNAPVGDYSNPLQKSTSNGDGVDPTLGLVRTMSMSSDKEILRSLRDAMNPKQKQQTRIMLVQASMGMLAVIILLGVVVVGYLSLREVRISVSHMAEQTAALRNITAELSVEMGSLNDNLAPVEVLPEFKQSLTNMHDGVVLLTNTICASPLFSAQCTPPATDGVDSIDSSELAAVTGTTNTSNTADGSGP
mmetsp:Transcript_15940/g.40661  ORF Transcript_15940/g.40661 Transcript_15940/m.40661 type:complete len:209 (+) Transcript_15940:245-871(+)